MYWPPTLARPRLTLPLGLASLHWRRSSKLLKLPQCFVRDRSQWRARKISLAEEGRSDDVEHLSPAERVAMVWQLTAQAWTFKDGHWDDPRLRRDVVRTVRGGR